MYVVQSFLQVSFLWHFLQGVPIHDRIIIIIMIMVIFIIIVVVIIIYHRLYGRTGKE